jgi:UDP-2,4-diacetamido-2,4,6-trideoxy-beta-L-altropyranose hydrolase
MTSGGDRPWLIRVASKPSCGAGHISRCRALGKTLKQYRPVWMVLDQGGEAWRSILERDGFAVAVAGSEPDLIWAGSVLDTYDDAEAVALDLSRQARPVVAIDDFLSPPSCCDLVVNSAPHLQGDRINGVPALLGSQYALLDSRFQRLPQRRVVNQVQHLVISFGKVDSCNATGMALETVQIARRSGFCPRVTVVMGGQALHIQHVSRLVQDNADQIRLLVDVEDMTEVWLSADLAIGGGGVSMLERMACGVPSITVSLASNQRLSVEGAARLGGTISAGEPADLTAAGLAQVISEIVANYKARQRLAERGRAIVDGHGAERVTAKLIAIESYAVAK